MTSMNFFFSTLLYVKHFNMQVKRYSWTYASVLGGKHIFQTHTHYFAWRAMPGNC